VKRRHQIIFYLLIAIFVFFSFECGSKNGSPIKIKSAKRAKKAFIGTPGRYQELTPVGFGTRVVLALKIKGISIDEFQNIQKSDEEEIYIAAGGLKFKPSVTRSGVIGGKKNIELFIVVPKDALELTLYVGSYPPKTFKVKGKILDELRD